MANEVEKLVKEFASNMERAIRAQVRGEVSAAVQKAIAGDPRAPAAASKRTPAQLAATEAKLLKYIEGHPGLRAEQIAKGTGISTGAMMLPIKRLLAAKKLKKASGMARGTTYVAVGK